MGNKKVIIKRYFGIWGYSDLLHNKISSEQITNLVHIQPLALAICSYLQQSQNPLPVPSSIALKKSPSPTKLTYFKDINATMNHDWIDTSAVDNNTRKSDKAPVPTQMWDSRIYLSFPLHKGLNMLVKALCLMLLRFYQRNLTRSFAQYLRTTYPLQYELYKAGHRDVRDGGNQNLAMTWLRDERCCTGTQTHRSSGSVLVLV